MNKKVNGVNEEAIITTPIAAGVRLYLNQNLDHGILQMVTEEAAGEKEMAPDGPHVLAQVAFTPDQLMAMAQQFASMADELMAHASQAADEAKPVEGEVSGAN